MFKIKETNDTKSRKWPKSFCIFFRKINFIQIKVIFSTNFRPSTNFRAAFEKNIKVSDFGLIWRPFREYLQINFFFENPALWLFYLYSTQTSCKKSEKFLRVVSEKTTLPTNQPTITNNTDFIGPGWRRSNKFTFGLQKLCLQVTIKTNTHNA